VGIDSLMLFTDRSNQCIEYEVERGGISAFPVLFGENKASHIVDKNPVVL
jgi:hypothetical protein